MKKLVIFIIKINLREIKSQQKLRHTASIIPEHQEKSTEVTKYNKNF